jgi:hypothetical protein
MPPVPAKDDSLSIPLIIVVLVIVAALVLAYFAVRTWHWGYVTVVVGLVLAGAGFYVLSAETLRTTAILRTNYEKLKADLDRVNGQITALEEGTRNREIINQLRSLELKMPDEADSIPSISKLEHEVRLLTQARGPVWRGATKAGVDRQAGMLQVTIAAPTPPGLLPTSVVYVFEEGEVVQPDPRRVSQYLGEFHVSQVAGQNVSLTPALELADAQWQRLTDSRQPLVIYETMPPDQHQLFAGLSEDDLRQKLPAASVEEYVRHGKAPEASDDPLRKAGYDEAENGKRVPPESAEAAARTEYQRRLRDYAVELRNLTERRAVLTTERAGVTLDNQRVVAATESAKQLGAFRQDEANKLTSDLTGLARDRQAVERLLTMVEQQVTTIRTLLDQTLQENSRLVRELAALQSAAASALNEPAASVTH